MQNLYEHFLEKLDDKSNVKCDHNTYLRRIHDAVHLIHYETRVISASSTHFVVYRPRTVTTARRIYALPTWGPLFRRQHGWLCFKMLDGQEITGIRSQITIQHDGFVNSHDGIWPWQAVGNTRLISRRVAESFDAWLDLPRFSCPNCRRWVVSTVQGAYSGEALWDRLNAPQKKLPQCVWHSALLDDNALIYNVRRLLPHVPPSKRRGFLRKHRKEFVSAAVGYYRTQLESDG